MVASSSSYGLAARAARELGWRLVIAEEKKFPDGESYVKLPSKVGGYVIVVHSIAPPQDTNFLKLLILIDAVKGAGADEVIVVVPYLAYARQDKRFLEGEPISVGVVLKSIESVGADAFVTVDVHSPKSLDEWLSIPHANAMPIPELASYFKPLMKDGVVLAPDKGAVERARIAAGILGVEYDYLEKFRDRVTGEVRITPKSVDVKGRPVLIVDDIISTGGTITLASKTVLEQGAKEVYVACTHALLVSGALDKIYCSGVKDVVATDTVPSPISKICVAPAIIRELKKMGYK